MRKQQRRDPARQWTSSVATVTVKSYGVDRYTAHDELTALGVTLPVSAQQWAQPQPATPATATGRDAAPVDNSWSMLDGRPFFVAGFTPGEVRTASTKMS
jgi:hypothetical protein